MSVIGLISLDNYDDVIDQLDDKGISYLNTMITTLISDWANKNQLFYKRMNSERYFFVATQEELQRLQQEKFHLLEEIKQVEVKTDFSLTMSIGIAYGKDSMAKIGEVAQDNLDLALARGGDQVVVKDTDPKAKPQFFGGNTDGTIKRNRTRSRAMSTALQKIFKENKKIFVMGHRYPDLDAIGAAFGVAYFAELTQRECYIVFDYEEITEDVHRCFLELEKYPELKKHVLSVESVAERVDTSSVLVMVDYQKPSLSVSQQVFEMFDKVVVIDHHRRGEEFPERPILSYIEPSASSASELVAEIIQYHPSMKKRKLNRFLATLLLAGIYVDTKNFTVRTTGRTFDTAAYLKRFGADLGMIQSLLSSNLDAYLALSRLVARSEFIADEIVLSTGEESEIYDHVIAAKAADTLLSMSGVKAAFVVTRRDEQTVAISARSSGALNVQKIMETLGGGGHFTNAATQLKGMTIKNAQKLLRATLK